MVHPEVDQHMGQHKEGRKRSLKTLLSLSQCRLIELDFLEALEEYDARSITGELSMWRALEASRYCSTNPAYKEARADVNVAARLLVSVRLVNCGPFHLKQKCWSVEKERSEDGENVYWHNFKMLPPPATAPAAVQDRASPLKAQFGLSAQSQFAPPLPTQGIQVQNPTQKLPPLPAQTLAATQLVEPGQVLQTSGTPHASASGNWLRMHVTPVNQIALVFCTDTHVWRPGSFPHSGGPRYLGMSTTTTSALVSSEASLIKSTTVPTAPFTSPALVQIFFVNMTLAPMHKQMTLSRPPANFFDALPAFFVRINGNTHTNRLPLGL